MHPHTLELTRCICNICAASAPHAIEVIVYLCICVSIHPSIYLYVCLYLEIHLYIHISIYV